MYSQQQLETAGLFAGALATDGDILLGTAGVVALMHPCHFPVMARALAALVTVQFDTAATILTLRKRITLGSDTGSTIIGTMTIPNGALVGKVYYKNFSPVKVEPGDQLTVETDGGTTAGAAILSVLAFPNWEKPDNNADMILAA